MRWPAGDDGLCKVETDDPKLCFKLKLPGEVVFLKKKISGLLCVCESQVAEEEASVFWTAPRGGESPKAPNLGDF